MIFVRAGLPALAAISIWWLATTWRPQLGFDRLSVRGTFVIAFLAFEVVVVGITEVLSAGHRLTGPGVTLAWLVVASAAAALAVRSGALAALRPAGGADARVHLRRRLVANPVEITVGATVLVLIGGVLCVTAWIYLPNNADSLVYHLARVSNWVQQSSVEHYATHITAQLELAPLHEFNMLHLHLLFDTDRLDGYVQLVSYVVCVVGASELARLLGASARTQLGAAVICGAIPSAIIEATSTQNNLFAAAIGVALMVIVLAWVPHAPLLGPTIALGAGTGLAVLGKGILLPLLGPVLILLVVGIAAAEARGTAWTTVVQRAAAAAGIIAVCAALIAGPHLKRNHDLFGSFGGPVTDATLNAGRSERASAANAVRSVALNFRIGDGRSGFETEVSRAALPVLGDVHDWIGASPDDPRFVIGGSEAFEAGDFDTFYQRHEDYGANPWHVVLIALSAVALLLSFRLIDAPTRTPVVMVAGLVLGFLLFTGVARWSLYATRYQLPLLVLWAPLIALALARVHRHLLSLVAGLLVVAGLPWLLDGTTRSLLHVDRRQESDLSPYVLPRPDIGYLAAPAADYVELRDALVASGCRRVGIGNLVLFEYPLWIGLHNAGWDGELRHVDVANDSAALEPPDFEPCATIRQGPTTSPMPDDQVEQVFGALTLTLDRGPSTPTAP